MYRSTEKYCLHSHTKGTELEMGRLLRFFFFFFPGMPASYVTAQMTYDNRGAWTEAVPFGHNSCGRKCYPLRSEATQTHQSF